MTASLAPASGAPQPARLLLPGQVLATLLPRLRERGFKCVTLSEAHQLELKRQALSVPGSPVL